MTHTWSAFMATSSGFTVMPVPAPTASGAAAPPVSPAPALVAAPPAPVPVEAPPAAAEEAATGEEVVVEPVPVDGDEVTVDGVSGGLEPGTAAHKKDAVADADGELKGSGEAAPVGTALESSCDADGDGIEDASCTTSGTSTTGIEQTPEPAQPVVKPRPKKPAAKKQAASKKPAARKPAKKSRPKK